MVVGGMMSNMYTLTQVHACNRGDAQARMHRLTPHTRRYTQTLGHAQIRADAIGLES